MSQLLTLKEIAKEIGVPESSVRKYREIFHDYIPGVGEGRARRYRDDAVAVFQDIRQLREDEHMPWDAIASKLGEKYPINAPPTRPPELPLTDVAPRSAPTSSAAAPAQRADIDARLRHMAAINERNTMLMNAMTLELLKSLDRYTRESEQSRLQLMRHFQQQTTVIAQTLSAVTRDQRNAMKNVVQRIDAIQQTLDSQQAILEKSSRVAAVKQKIIAIKRSVEEKDNTIRDLSARVNAMSREIAELRALRRQTPTQPAANPNPAPAPAPRPAAPVRRKEPEPPPTFLQKLFGKKS